MKILAIGSHPDDIEIFMFGFLSACLSRGDEIFLVIATDGSAGGKITRNKLIKTRENETINGLRHLGKPIFLNYKDGDLHNELSASNDIRAFIEKNKPDLIVTHAPEDYHQDHRTLSKYVKNAARFDCPVIFCDTLLGVNFLPEYYVDITNYFDLKKEAIMAHKSQNPKRFCDAIEIQNRFRAAQCNSPKGHYAEAYRFEKSFPFSDIRQLIPEAPKYRPYYQNLKSSLI